MGGAVSLFHSRGGNPFDKRRISGSVGSGHTFSTNTSYFGNKEDFMFTEEDEKFLKGPNCLIDWYENEEIFKHGVEVIDSQHKKLVKLINKLNLATRDGNRELIEEVFHDLVQYTNYHFKTEERLMEEFNYRKEFADSHVEIHRRFVDKVIQLREKFFSGDRTAAFDALDFLKEWLSTHIAKTDKRLCEYILEILWNRQHGALDERKNSMQASLKVGESYETSDINKQRFSISVEPRTKQEGQRKTMDHSDEGDQFHHLYQNHHQDQRAHKTNKISHHSGSPATSSKSSNESNGDQ